MEAFDFDERRAKKKTIENFLQKKPEEFDSIQRAQENVSSSDLQDNSQSEEMEIKNPMSTERRLDKNVLQKNMKGNIRLNFNWIYWGYEKKTHYYKKNLRKIKSFATVDEFRSIHYKIKKSHPRLVEGDVYCVFKEGIMPLVDDPRNELGGEWMICFERDDKGRPANMESEWWDVLWTVIVEGFGDDDSGVCGVDIDLRGNIKNRDVISVWTSDWTNMQQLSNILAKIVARLNLGKNVSIRYQTHH